MSDRGHSARPVDPRHDLLIRAVLSPGEAGRRAYEQWRPGVEVQTLDLPSTTLLAPLAERLGDTADDLIASQVNKVARMTWLRGQLLVALTTPVLQDMSDLGIRLTLTKGAAVLHHCGLDLRARPMDDVDVWVTAKRVRHATHRLVAHGFDSELAPLLGSRPEAALGSLHAAIFRNPRGARVDLHWHLLANRLHPRADAAAWDAAVPAHWGDVPVQVTSREDTLLHVVVHGAGFMQSPALRWTTDAAALLRSGPVDWAVVVDRAALLRLGPTLADGLTYLCDVAPDLAIPADAVEALTARPPAPVDRLLARVDRPPDRTNRRRGDRVRRTVARAAADWRRSLDAAVEPGAEPRVRDLAWVVAEEWWGRRAPRTTPSLRLGHWVSGRLRADGSGAPQLVSGWHYPEPHGTWSAQRHARIAVTLERPEEGPLVLLADLLPFLSPARPRMRVEVRIDGQPATTWRFRGQELRLQRRKVRIPARPGRTTVDVLLDIHDPMTGYDNGTFGDERALGVALNRFVVRSAARMTVE